MKAQHIKYINENKPSLITSTINDNVLECSLTLNEHFTYTTKHKASTTSNNAKQYRSLYHKRKRSDDERNFTFNNNKQQLHIHKRIPLQKVVTTYNHNNTLPLIFQKMKLDDTSINKNRTIKIFSDVSDLYEMSFNLYRNYFPCDIVPNYVPQQIKTQIITKQIKRIQNEFSIERNVKLNEMRKIVSKDSYKNYLNLIDTNAENNYDGDYEDNEEEDDNIYGDNNNNNDDDDSNDENYFKNDYPDQSESESFDNIENDSYNEEYYHNKYGNEIIEDDE